MAIQEHLEILLSGHESWNKWRESTGTEMADFSGVQFDDNTSFEGYNLFRCNFSGCKLNNAIFNNTQIRYCLFNDADLSFAKMNSVIIKDSEFNDHTQFIGAFLDHARIYYSHFKGGQFPGASLKGAVLSNVDLTGASLYEADLRYCTFAKVDLSGASLNEAKVYGISVWDANTEKTRQEKLVITPPEDSPIIVDDIEVAQFIYLLLNHQKIRNVINTMTSKTVLLLGSFSEGRKEVLNVIAMELRNQGYIPMIFDFEKCNSKNFTDTVKILASLSLFVIADVSRPRSIPMELQATVPYLEIPFILIIQKDEEPFSMVDDLLEKDYVSKIQKYPSIDYVISNFDQMILKPVEEIKRQITEKREKVLRKKSNLN